MSLLTLVIISKRRRYFKNERTPNDSYSGDVWVIDFMGPFVSSNGMMYILVEVYYVSKWVEAITFSNNEGNSVTTFLKGISSLDLVYQG